MTYPDEFINRVYRTKLSGLSSSLKKLDEICLQNPESEIDIVYENLKAVVVIVFATQEDCLAFTLKYGKDYV
jgi:hypothetical protein